MHFVRHDCPGVRGWCDSDFLFPLGPVRLLLSAERRLDAAFKRQVLGALAAHPGESPVVVHYGDRVALPLPGTIRVKPTTALLTALKGLGAIDVGIGCYPTTDEREAPPPSPALARLRVGEQFTLDEPRYGQMDVEVLSIGESEVEVEVLWSRRRTPSAGTRIRVPAERLPMLPELGVADGVG